MKANPFHLIGFMVLGLAGSSALKAQSAERYSFEQLWGLVKKNAPLLGAAERELEASQIAASRASRHWFPHLSGEARAFATNDPAQSFMSNLGQRQITMQDFSPDALNQPGSHLYEHVTLGLELPLYEGGMKTAMAAAASKAVDARGLEKESVLQNHYVELARQYADLMVAREERAELDKLKGSVDEILSRYNIGSRANPVGYSGLLGLKNLKNRIQGMLVENGARAGALQTQIGTQAGNLPQGWIPESVPVGRFLKAHLPISQEDSPPAVQAARAAADALSETRGAEHARFLPQVGLFAQADLYGGNRAVGTSYMTGAFLRWDLFSAGNIGAVEQAEKSAAAAAARADAAAQQAQIARESSLQAIRSVEANLALMDESAKLLEEQTTTARALFRNGSINALQLVEVLSRRADLLANRATAELELSRATAAFSMNSGSGKKEGSSHE